MVERKMMSYRGILRSGLAVYMSRPSYFSAQNWSPSFPSTIEGRPVRRSCIAHYLRGRRRYGKPLLLERTRACEAVNRQRSIAFGSLSVVCLD